MDKTKEAKLITLAIAKLRDFCRSQDDCNTCPLAEQTTGGNYICSCSDTSPQEWDPDTALYRLGFFDGRKV